MSGRKPRWRWRTFENYSCLDYFPHFPNFRLNLYDKVLRNEWNITLTVPGGKCCCLLLHEFFMFLCESSLVQTENNSMWKQHKTVLRKINNNNSENTRTENGENAWKSLLPPPYSRPLRAYRSLVINSSCKRFCQPRNLDINCLNALICWVKITQHAQHNVRLLANKFLADKKIEIQFELEYIKVSGGVLVPRKK